MRSVLLFLVLVPAIFRPSLSAFAGTPGSDATNSQFSHKFSGSDKAKPQPPAKPDISGMYTFLREGEFVQVTIEEGGVSGFVSRFGDTESDRGTFLDQFFDRASYDGGKLTFTTKTVHSTWFEFNGNVVRGNVPSPAKEGYWVIKGTLIQYTKDPEGKTSAKSREVEFKSFPQSLDEDGSATRK